MENTREPINDSFLYLDTDGQRKSASVVVVYGKDGNPVNQLKVMARRVVTAKGRTKGGWQKILNEDPDRTGLVVRNAGDTDMLISTSGPLDTDGEPDGYPLDARRGYSFEAFGMLPMNEVWIFCPVGGKKWAAMYAPGDGYVEEVADA